MAETVLLAHRLRNIVKNEKGFTLLEMLIVLSIFLVVNSAILYFSHKPLIEYTEEQVMTQNELVIRMAQMKAIETQSTYMFRANNCRRIIVRDIVNPEFIYDQRLPDGVELYISTPRTNLLFNPSGNVQSFGQLTYHFERISYRYTVHIGKGRIIGREVLHGPARTEPC